MKHRILCLTIFFITAGIVLLSQSGCKEHTILNANIAPATDNIQTDTARGLSISCKTIFMDSIITSNSFSGISIIHALGVVNDPYFGRTTAGIYVQVVPPSGFALPDGFILDSAVLILPYTGFTWGDTASHIKQNITVKQLKHPLSQNNTYYSFSADSTEDALLGSAAVDFDAVSEDVYLGAINNDTVRYRAPHLRVKLNETFKQLIYSDSVNFTNFADAATFNNWFHGLYITSDSRARGTALPYFYIDGYDDYSRTNILLYYRQPGDTITHTQSLAYNSSTCAHYNAITRNYRGTQVQSHLQSTAVSDNELLVQNLPGCAIDIRISGLNSIPRSIVNKAELVFTTVSTPGEATYTPPFRLYPLGVDAAGASYTIADGYPITSTAPLAFIDGTKRTTTIGSNVYTQYIVNIPREIQKAVAAGVDSVHLHITGTTDFYGAYRAVLGGTSNADTKIQLHVLYSKVNTP